MEESESIVGGELSAYLADGFDAVERSRGLLALGEAEGVVVRLRQQRDQVDAALRELVGQHHDHLAKTLFLASGSEGATRSDGTKEEGGRKEDVDSGGGIVSQVGRGQETAATLRAGLERLERDLANPCKALRAEACTLKNLRAACAALDAAKRFVREVSKLKTQLYPEAQGRIVVPSLGKELAKAAQLLHETEELLKTESLQGLEVVERERNWLQQAGTGVRAQTESILNKAIEELSQTEAAFALQAFFNLGILPSRVDASVDWVVSKVAEEAKNSLDVHLIPETLKFLKTAKPGDKVDLRIKKNPSGRIKPPPGEEGEWKDALMKRVEALEASIAKWSLRVWNLERVLKKKRDPVTHVCFSDVIIEAHSLSEGSGGRNSSGKRRLRPESVYERYWRLATQALHGEIEKAARSYPFLRRVLGSQEYPSLRRMFHELPGKLAKRTAGKSVVSIGGTGEEVQAILRSLQPLLEWFLAQSVRRLNDPVDLMFPEDDTAAYAVERKQDLLPTRNDVSTFASTISSEISIARGDLELTNALCQGACASITLFAIRAQKIVVKEKEAREFEFDDQERKRNSVQEHNVAVLNLVLKLDSFVAEIPTKTTNNKLENSELLIRNKSRLLRDGRQRLQALAGIILDDYVASAANSLNDVLVRMHDEDFCKEDQGDMGSTSPYLAAFESAMQFLKSEHIGKLPTDYEIVVDFVHKLQARIMSMFVRQVTLIRPLNSNGRMQLARDLPQFELAVDTISIGPEAKLSKAGDPYIELRNLRQLLFDDEGSFPEMRRSSLLQFMFGNAPAALQSPHQVNKQTEQEYIKMLDNLEGQKSVLDIGSKLEEPPEVTRKVEALVSASLDRYMEIQSARGSNEICSQYEAIKKYLQSSQ